MPPTVLIIYRSVPEYRRPFYERLRAALAQDHIELELAHGDPVGADRFKSDSASLSWATRHRNVSIVAGTKTLVWQPVYRQAQRADLVIVEQASKLLVNYPLLAASRVRGQPRVALWGHGANLQAHTVSRVGEALKRQYSRMAHWWFPYTEGGARRVSQLGFPTDRITVVQNAIETIDLKNRIAALRPDAVSGFRARFTATEGYTGLFIGSLYGEKRLSFLIDAAVQANAHEPRFRLLIAGDGPDREFAQHASGRHPFIHYLGRVDGNDRLLALATADVTLMPGLVGLAVLDAFAARAPMITTAVNYHSPEIEYLADGVNGIVLPSQTTPSQYAKVVLEVLNGDNRLTHLRKGCESAAVRYDMQHMVSNFRSGIKAALVT